MKRRQPQDEEASLARLQTLQLVVALVFFAQLIGNYLLPLRSHSLDPHWWTWLSAAAPVVVIGALEILKNRRTVPRLRGESAERLCWERPRRYGRTH